MSVANQRQNPNQFGSARFKTGARRFALITLVTLIALTFSTTAVQAQNRVDLDDLNIKGELLNDNRLRLSARDPHKMAERVNYRENFRPEIIDGLEVAWPAKVEKSSAGVATPGENP